MKTQNLLVSYERKEKVVRIFALVSVIGIAIVLIFGLFSLIFKDPLSTTIAAFGLIILILPVVLLQFFMSAGIYGFGLGGIYVLFYLFLFPFADMLFFGGANAIFHIVPNYHLMDAVTKNDLAEKAWLFIGGIYFFVNGLGLIWRLGKKTRCRIDILNLKGSK